MPSVTLNPNIYTHPQLGERKSLDFLSIFRRGKSTLLSLLAMLMFPFLFNIKGSFVATAEFLKSDYLNKEKLFFPYTSFKPLVIMFSNFSLTS